MINYFIGTVFIIVFTLFLYSFGRSIHGNDASDSYCLMVGYILYIAFIGVGIIPIQIFNLPWVCVGIYMTIVISIIVFYIFYKFRSNKLVLFDGGIKVYIKNNWFLYLISIILIGFTLQNIEWLWQNNCLDDGYYIGKVATIANNKVDFYTTYAVGQGGDRIFSYALSVWETEASYYVKILNISVTVFLRFFMAMFGYFLLANIVKELFARLVDIIGLNCKESNLQFSSMIIIIFSFNYTFLLNNGILNFADVWQYNTAMYYGSTIVRTCCILMMLVPFLSKEKFGIKDVIFEMIICFSMLTRSSVALPLAVFTPIIFLCMTYIIRLNKTSIIGIVILIFIAILSFMIPNYADVQNTINVYVDANIHSIALYIFLIIFLMGFLFKNKLINRINCTVILLASFTSIDGMNNIFERLSQYGFVAGRAMTSIFYIIIILGFLYVAILVMKIISNKLVINLICCLLLASICSLNIYSYGGFNIVKSNLGIIRRNIELIPNSTVELGKKLELIDKDINVLIPRVVVVNNHFHSLSIIIRTQAQNCYPITACERYGVSKENLFSEFSYNELMDYENFNTNPNEELLDKVRMIQKKYSIDCIIVTNGECKKYLESIGYKQMDTVFDSYNAINYWIFQS